MSIRRLIYTLLLYILIPIFVLRLLFRSRKNPAFRERLLERFGFVKPQTNKPLLWFHVVSVGETLGAKPLINRLLDHYPDHTLLITSTTLTGSNEVKKLFGDRALQSYFPYDLPGSIHRFLKRVKPEKLIIMETEIWPNLYAACYQQNIPIVLVNARLSQRSMRSYLRFQKLTEETLNRTHVIAARDQQDAEHFKQLGASEGRVKIAGNIKFDLQLPESQIEQGLQFRNQWGEDRLVWVAASTHEGEDAPLLEIYKTLQAQIPELIFILIPRHPERFESVYQLVAKTDFNIQRRSQSPEFTDDAQIIIGDSMGEMFSWLAASNIVFMGGSLVETGGHNPLEPAALAKPVVSGKYIFNFAEVYELLKQQDATWVLGSNDAIADKLLFLLKNSTERQQAGKQAKALLEQHRGVVERLLQYIQNS